MERNELGLWVCDPDVADSEYEYDTLVYQFDEHFCFFQPANGAELPHWHDYCDSLEDGLEKARAAGLNPTACLILHYI